MTPFHGAQPDLEPSGTAGAAVAASMLPPPARFRVEDPDVGFVELIVMVSSLSETDDAETIIELYELWLRRHPLDPQRFGVHFNHGTLLNGMGRYADALAALEEAIRLAPGFLASYINAGVALENLGRLQEAAAHWLHVANCPVPNDDRAIPVKIAALRHLARTCESAADYACAEIAYRQCLEIGPHQRDVIDHWVLTRQLQCKWPSVEPCGELARSALIAALSPLPLAILTSDPLFQVANAARYFEQDIMGPLASRAAASWVPPAPPKARKQRLRIGYVSPDLRGHAIGFLTAELFGLHDRTRVEVFAYYSGLPSPDATQARIRQTVDHWTDIAGWSPQTAAQRIADDGIDILIDLGGHTNRAPTAMFALRPAPVIVNWLGYPGSMGTPDHQYIIADATIIPPGHEKYYTERVVRLPCYQPTDRQRIVARQPSRHEVGLPDGVVVYCCFNGPQKITPATFRCWMTILARVPRGVLWLLSNDAPTEERLRQQAVCHGIAPERLIFARRKPNAEHMARYPFADLFLDTSPYGAHTTASDALWMGVPVLTIAGLSFASRVCASLVTAAGLPELVCDSPQAYIDRAVELGTRPDLLSALRQKLWATRDRCALFDMKLLVTRLEALYAGMWDDYVSGQLPEPDLTNLSLYHAIGAGFGHDAAEGLDQLSYERKYLAALAARHDLAPVPPDCRLWHGSPRQPSHAKGHGPAPPGCHDPAEAASTVTDARPNPSFNALTATNVRIKVVDVGADPVDASPPYAAMLRSGHATVVGFEPNPGALARLNDMKGPHETYLPWAVADGRQHTLHICQASGMTSLLQPNPDVLNLFPGLPDRGRVLATEKTGTVRLDGVAETEGVQLIKISIQGGELMALRNAISRLRETLVIQSEVEFMPMYVGQPLFSELESFLRQQGFMLHRLFPRASRVQPLPAHNDNLAGASQLLWADAIFVRDLTRLDLLLDSQLLSMAAILHDCYRSTDLVLHLLAEHDRRTGGLLGSAYLSGLRGGVASETVRS